MDIIPVVTKENVNKNEIESVQKEQQEYKLIGSFLRTRGLKLFSYNPSLNLITEIVIEKHKTLSLGVDAMNGNLTRENGIGQEKCTFDSRNIPFEALNMKNALKRVNNYKEGKVKYLCNLIPCK